tara:strand:- start:517 stop:1419 length:903 start_codon:yes stop_codon:yes gene_type:complete
MGALDRQGRHVMPKKVSTEQNIAQLLGGGQGEEPEPDEFTVDAPKAPLGGKGNPSQDYWKDLLSGPMGGQGLGEGEASRAELEEGGLDEGEEADPDVRDSTFDTLHQEAPDPTIDHTTFFESAEDAENAGDGWKDQMYRETAPDDLYHDPDALWPHEVHQEREAQEHEGEMDAMHAAMSAINPDHRSPIGHIPGLDAESSGHGQDIMDRAVNRPEPMDQAMDTLQPEQEEDPMGQAMDTLQESASDQQEDFDEAEDARQERNVQTQARVNPRGPPPAPGSANYEQNIAAWRAGQKKRGRR